MKEKEIYDKIVVETNNEINALNNRIKYGKLTYYFKSEGRIPVSFNGFTCPLGLKGKIIDASIDVEKAKKKKKRKEKFRSNLNEITRGK